MSSKPGAKTEAGLSAISANAKELDHSAWTRNPEAVEAINLAKRLRQTKHGMYAAVPIICKSDTCPYSATCPLVKMEQAPYGEKCPIEIAAIEELFERYASNFSIDLDKKNPGDTVDLMMIKDLVDADIGLLRCDQKMAWDADYIIHNTVGVTDEGEAITKQELHPLTEYREKLINRKHKTFQLLNSTRKDKVGSKITLATDPSIRASEMLKVKEEMSQLEEIEKEAERKYYEKVNKGSTDIIDVEPIDFEEGE